MLLVAIRAPGFVSTHVDSRAMSESVSSQTDSLGSFYDRLPSGTPNTVIATDSNYKIMITMVCNLELPSQFLCSLWRTD